MGFKEIVEKASAAVIKALKWVAADGMLHFALSALIILAFGWIRPIWGAVVIAVVLGVIKEMYDIAKSGQAVLKNSMHDFICDGVGILFGLFVVWLNTLA